MSRRYAVIAGLLALVVVAVFALCPPIRTPAGAEVQPPQNQIAVVEPSYVPQADSVEPPRVVVQRKIDAEEREAYRRRILDGLRRGTDARRGTDHRSRASRDDDEEYAVADIRDRTHGQFAAHVEAINHDFMPLADECYAQALERTPGLAGMLDANVEIVADETIGGLVETLDFGEQNEIEDPQMLECVRETMLSTIFPAPEATGRDQMRLTLRFAPDDEG